MYLASSILEVASMLKCVFVHKLRVCFSMYFVVLNVVFCIILTFFERLVSFDFVICFFYRELELDFSVFS